MEIEAWDDVRAEALAPRTISGAGDTDRVAFLEGARALGLVGRRLELKPHQLLVPEVLDAGHEFNAILMPRRSTKSTSILAWIMGRCLTRDDYLVAYIYATTAKKARMRFAQDIVPMLGRTFEKGAQPFKIRSSAGMERIEFDNGSVFAILAPKGDDLRSDAWDLIVVDEAGEAEPTLSEELLSAALPTMDTRPSAQFVVTGTAGKYRKGCLLWDQLEEGRGGVGGILEYAASDILTADEVEEWDQAADLLLECHPGVTSGLTTLATLESRFHKMRRSLFMGEYLSIFGDLGGGSSIISPAKWAAAEVPFVMAYPEPPERFGLAISVTPGLTAGAIVAAWRDREGTAHLLLLEHREGIRWMAERTAAIARKYRQQITHDNFGSVMVVVEEMHQQTPRPRLDPQTTRGTTTAAGKLVEQIDVGMVRHYGQDALTSAALAARKRTVGPKAWAFGRRDLEDDIAAIEAASLALRAFDEMPQRQSIRLLRPSA